MLGTTLNGERIALPDGFAGERNLVVLGFSTADRDAVTSWERVGLRRYSVAFYALPTLGSGSLVSRFFIDNALRFAVTGEDARERTIALHLDRAAFPAAPSDWTRMAAPWCCYSTARGTSCGAPKARRPTSWWRRSMLCWRERVDPI